MNKILIVLTLLATVLFSKNITLNTFQELKPIKKRGVSVTNFLDKDSIYLVQGIRNTRRGQVPVTFAVSKDLQYTFFAGFDNSTEDKIYISHDMNQFKAKAHFTYGTGKKEFYLFTDPQCPYCIKFEESLLRADIEDKVKIHYFLYPLPKHKDAKAMSNYILTQKDKHQALQEIMINNSKVYKGASSKLSPKLKEAKNIVLKVGVRGTPSLYDSSGKKLNPNKFLKDTVYSKEVCIDNFGKRLCGDFKLLDSVIVKSKLSKKELQQKLNKPIKQIAFLENSGLYLVDTKDSLEYSKELAKEEYIIYAQPNILQQRDESHGSGHNHVHSIDIVKKYGLKNIWKSTKGEGVNIAIIDDGFELEHEDLKGTNTIFSYDSDYKNLNASSKIKIDKHGTKVAGVLFARHNGVGIEGIVPDANLIAIRQTLNITSDTIVSFTVADKAKAHIINCSWNSPYLLEPVYDVIKHIAKTKAVVFSAGNDSKKIKPLSIEASISEVITVGTEAKYSNYGDVVDFIVPSNIKTTKVNNNYGNFSGTSASASVVSGLIALEMSQNTDISLEQIVKNLKGKL